MTSPVHSYEVRPRKDCRLVDLISDVLPFGGFGMKARKPSRPQSENA
jgi:hypothetical protein